MQGLLILTISSLIVIVVAALVVFFITNKTDDTGINIERYGLLFTALVLSIIIFFLIKNRPKMHFNWLYWMY